MDEDKKSIAELAAGLSARTESPRGDPHTGKGFNLNNAARRRRIDDARKRAASAKPPAVDFSDQEKLEAVERELRFRRRVYAYRVSEGRMTKVMAERQIGLFEAIRRDYLGKVDLFGGEA